jgi:nucleoside-diphosphate-sugar epimerase
MTLSTSAPLRVVVTGAAGFLGRRLVRRLRERGSLALGGGAVAPIREIVACDLAVDAEPATDGPRVTALPGDVADPALIDALVAGSDAIFHLAAVVSVAAEQDFALGRRVNLLGFERLLEACRLAGRKPRLAFASSAAVYGGELPAVVEDGTPPCPQTSYGMQKAIGELLLNDYSRRGFVDGRALRLPTIAVRPGRPNQAASAFASSLVREPLEGRTFACPVARETSVCLLSPGQVVESFLHAIELPAEAWGPTRVAQLPGLTTTVDGMLAALAAIAGPQVAARVSFAPDPAIARIVAGWPTRFDSRRSQRLGFRPDASIEQLINAFIAEDLGGRIAR